MAKKTQLTDLKLRRAKPGSWISDPFHRGLRFYCGDGRLISVWYRYRSLHRTAEDGKPVLDSVKLGYYPDLTLEHARHLWRELKVARSKGVDPKLHFRREQKTAKPYTVKQLVDGYLRAWAKNKKDAGRNDARVLYKDLVSRYGDEPAAKFSLAQAKEMFEEVSARGEKDAGAEQLLAVCRRAWNHCIQQNADESDESKKTYIVSNPFAKRCIVNGRLEPASEKGKNKRSTKQHWDDLDLQRFLRWLPGSMPEPIQNIALLMLYTGSRPGEVVDMTWREVDLQRETWTVPGDRYKTGTDHKVMLSRQAVALLRSLPRESEKVFEYRYRGFHNRWQKSLQDAPVPYIVPHALRHSVATGLGRARVPTEIISRVLGHVLGGMTEQVYQHHQRDEAAKEALQAWCDHLDALKQDHVHALAG
jgi:integrase